MSRCRSSADAVPAARPSETMPSANADAMRLII
jgi:hypothetical protein